MKLKWDKNRRSRTLSNFAVVFFGIAVFFLFYRSAEIMDKISWLFSLLTPFFMGFILAYFLNPIVTFLEKHVLRFIDVGRERKKTKRAISISICIILTLLLFAFLLFMFIPRLINNLSLLFNNLPGYAQGLTTFLRNLLSRYHIDPNYIQPITLTSDQLIDMIANTFSNILPTVLSYSAKTATFFMNLIIGIVISIYFLQGKELFLAQTKKIIYAVFPLKNADRIIEVSQLTHKTFINFIMGKLVDSVVVGVLCFLGLYFLLKIPNALLLAVIIGISNIIPFFGPYLGAILSSILVLLTAPSRIIWFWLLVFILQQIDANIIDPRISGKTTGIPPVWVIFAIILGGGFFGMIGLLVAVPAFAVFFVLFKAYAEKQLEIKGMPKKTEDFSKPGKVERIEKPEE